MRATVPITRDLLLIGGGHAHAIVLKMWGMKPLPGVRLTLINPDPTAPYTGMLPGLVAGHYQRNALEIDLVRLARFAGARLVLDRVVGLDLAKSRAQLAERPDIAFDLVSIDIGIGSGLAGIDQGQAWPAKPLGAFTDAWEAFVAKVIAGTKAPSVAVIGGGLGGVELAMAMAHRLGGACPDRRAIKITLVEAQQDLLATSAPALGKAMRSGLAELGVKVLTGSAVTAIEGARMHLATGDTLEADFMATVAGARPAAWLSQTGLALHEGFISIDETLRSLSHQTAFAVGDTAHMQASPRPKAGVFAVRQGPILYHNLRAALSGRRLKPFRPQTDYLKLVSLGGQKAVAEKWGLCVSGAGLWRLKDQIDQKFMAMLSTLPTMAAPDMAPGPVALGVTEAQAAQPLCGGCGSKVGPEALASALSDLAPPTRADVLAGRGDDAAVLAWGAGDSQVFSCDHFRAFSLDPYVMAQITANHALGDIWAMGGDPQAALASIILPPMTKAKQSDTVAEIVAGFQASLQAAGADLVGGHTSLGAELTLGLSVTGLMQGRKPLGLGGAQPGDVLVLTKPVGVGTVMAAEMPGLAKGGWVAASLNQMLASSGPASRLLRNHAHAMTDITGFGLAGHVQGLLSAAHLSATLDLNQIRWTEGAIDLARAGIRSSIFPETSRFAQDLQTSASVRADPRFDLLFDPQTAGGLVAAVPAEAVQDLSKAFADQGLGLWIIGALADEPSQIPTLTITAAI
jgi:selenide,water dikinase